MKTDTVFYIISWIIIVGLAVIGVLHYTGLFIPTDDLIWPCFFRRATGLYCPGCGGTHAVEALVEGHLADSFLAHPFVIYVSLCAVIYTVTNTIGLIRFRVMKHSLRPPESAYILHFRMIYLYIGIAILFIQWIIKNIILIA